MKQNNKNFSNHSVKLLDSIALLSWINDSKGAQTIENILYSAQKNGTKLLMSIISLGEIYQHCIREKNDNFAQEIIDKINLLPIEIKPCSDEIVFEAAKIKAKYSLNYPECFAIATAKQNNAVIVTSNAEFKQVQDLIEIEWI
jgi:ribonuclease VapC